MQYTMIQVPTDLHAQLKALAAARRTTMVDVLAHTVRKAVEDGEIEGPSNVQVLDGCITIAFPDGSTARMTLTEAKDVADSLDEVANEGGGVECSISSGKLEISRKGGAVVLGHVGNPISPPMDFSPTTIRNLAWTLRNKVTRFEAQSR